MSTSNTSTAVRSTVGLGVALMLFGDFLFATNDVIGKWLVSTYTVGQVLLIRSLFALAVLAPILWRTGLKPLIHVEKPWTQLARVVLATLEVFCFYAAVVYLPLADVFTIYLAGPIYIAALSHFMLGERVGWRRWTAIGVGFVGVVIALNPSAATLSLPSLISLAGSFAFALMIVQSRQLRRTPDTTLVFWQTVGALVAGLLLAPFGWVQPTAMDFSLLGLLGVVALFAHLCINRALKLAPAALLAPLQYTLLLWAIVYGWFIFGDVPKMQMMVGAAIIVGAGLFLFERQKKVESAATKAAVQDLV